MRSVALTRYWRFERPALVLTCPRASKNRRAEAKPRYLRSRRLRGVFPRPWLIRRTSKRMVPCRLSDDLSYPRFGQERKVVLAMKEPTERHNEYSRERSQSK